MPIPALHLTTTSVGEVDAATGSDGNAGFFDPTISGGVDYTNGAGQKTVTFDGTTIKFTTSGSTATITIVGYTVLVGDVGNSFNITGGTNVTTGLYTIDSVSTGSNTWTLHATVTTGATTNGAGVAGGALATPGQGGGIIANPASNIGFFLKAGTYGMSASTNVASGSIILSGNGTWICGYSTNRIMCNNDTRPVIQSSANSVTIITDTGGNHVIANLDIQNGNSNTGVIALNGTGDNGDTLYRVNAQGVATGFKVNQGWQIYFCSTIDNTGTDGGYTINSSETILYGCVSINCKNGFVGTASQSFCVKCISAGSAGTGYGFINFRTVQDCIAYNPATTLAGFKGCTGHINCIAVGASGVAGYGFDPGTGQQGFIVNCAGFNNTSNYHDVNTPPTRVFNFIALSADPFVSAGTTTSADFTLNTTSGGGTLLQSLGFPTTWPGFGTASYSDVGAIQHASATPGALIPSDFTGGLNG